MKIVIAPDSFKENLTSLEVASEIEKGLKMKASGHGRAVSLFGMAPGRVHLSRSVQGVAAHLS